MSREFLFFASLMVVALGIEQTWICRHCRKLVADNREDETRHKRFRQLSTSFILLTLLISVGGGLYLSNYFENVERREQRAIPDGIIPILAYELQRMSHTKITLDTPADDPHYLALTGTMVRWMQLNPQIRSIYTFQRTSAGTTVFILSPETDFEHDGVINGTSKVRVPIGTEYGASAPAIAAAFAGRYAFQETPTEDEWGPAISAFMPIYGDDPSQPEAVLGIDFSGTAWNEGRRVGHLQAIGLSFGCLMLLNLGYLIFCYGWFERQQIRRRVLSEEMARLDRLNLVGEVAASIGHEIRNPLTTVRGYLQLMKKGATEAKQNARLDLMIGELDQANAIITEFLLLAKNKAVELQPTDLNAVLEKLFPLLQADALLAGHEIKLHTTATPTVLLDEKEIKQLILNLTRNALEAMHGSGAVTIGTRSSQDAAILTIQDTGQGIAPEIMAKLGTPFLTTKPDGNGLGLAVCFRIAQRHGAKVSVETNPCGTTFTVYFPAC